uniref:cytochrome c oxidase subunit II n=1 Tax=Euurobracon yokahamae TaxID=2911681 RepID=UPI002079BD19|nr:cytochrome c oxidase subunit II [Euurobracon yokahamae]UJJ81885.1 cytochrome c oxidase subunit II [Euurobracon yokahamae]
MYYWLILNFQDFNSNMSMLMIEFHDLSLILLLMIMIFILYMILYFFMNKFVNKFILHNQMIEIIWTLVPIIILLFMVIPSLKILYMSEESMNSFLTLKILGHQWYWSYEYSDFKGLEYDSFMLSEFTMSDFRLLDVDNRLILPFKFNIRSLVSSLDVIHSWTIPCIGVKVDAIPGRMNQLFLYFDRLGVYYGQCSEICGLNHSFMPIVVESTELKMFFFWINNF